MRQIDAILAWHVTDPVGPEFMAPPLRSPSPTLPIETEQRSAIV
jgi:hypothetical protein